MFGLNFRCLLQFYIFLFWYRYHSTIKAKQTNRDYEAAEKKKPENCGTHRQGCDRKFA